MGYDKEKKKLAMKKYYEANKEKLKQQQQEYYQNNKDSYSEYQKKYREDNKEDLTDKRKIYNEENKERIAEYSKQYIANNFESIKKTKKNWVKNQLETNPLFKLKLTIQNSIRQSLKKSGFKKLSRTEQILGCTYDEFVLYIESKFEGWMNWDNHGNWNGIPSEINTAWDIDHIIPLSTATCEADILRLNHYTNLQPLCSYVNRVVKRDNI